MNFFRFFCVGGVSLLCLGQTLGAAPADNRPPPPLPEGPLLKKPADWSAWRIRYTYASDNSAALNPALAAMSLDSLNLRQVTITRTKPLWSSSSETTSHKKLEQWFTGAARFCKASDEPGPFLLGIPDPRFPDYSRGFPDLDWVDAKSYSGVDTVEGHPCLVFTKGGMIAWIDLKTRYPLKWQNGDEKRSFDELPVPTALLTLPKEVIQEDRAIKKDLERLNRKVPSA